MNFRVGSGPAGHTRMHQARSTHPLGLLTCCVGMALLMLCRPSMVMWRSAGFRIAHQGPFEPMPYPVRVDLVARI